MEYLECYRVCVFVPAAAMEQFIASVSPRIPSFLGNYDCVCWWSEAGTEQYRELGQLKPERALCHRFECSVPADDGVLEGFIKDAVLPAHPWKEPIITVTKQKIVKRAP